ncbi:hypothetical protein M4D81_28125 [Paenibacillus sp. p3-SID867]|uniref:hypothetical protein n=1 Tax=Paenibacillus sp. p3-SID867 TaxID=2916363 RepID=UPI0021A4A63B|nr:hypothetical protein [Paenibacillus sp. p3-SID867]MCT1402867.1 hypothetical protein [Paenibacillus sp. p3-SID867]
MENGNLLSCIDEYYGDLIEELTFLRYDEEKLVFFHPWLEKQTVAIDIKKVGLDPNNVDQFKHLFNLYDYKADNPGMWYYPRKGFFLKNYCELLVSYSPIHTRNGFKFDHSFSIGNTEIRFGIPSPTYKFIFNHLLYDSASNGTWDSFYTVSINNVEFEEVERLIEQALYYISRIYAPLQNDYPEIITFYGDDWNGVNHFDANENNELTYQKHKYDEVFMFYNEGRRKKDPLSLYRVLEYFFIPNRKSEFETISESYVATEDLDAMILEITKIFKTQEDNLLSILLEKIKTHDLVEYAFHNGLIRLNTLDDFSAHLYKFRNSIVHSKKETRNEFILPGPLSSELSDKWLNILEKLSRRCIHKFIQ